MKNYFLKSSRRYLSLLVFCFVFLFLGIGISRANAAVIVDTSAGGIGSNRGDNIAIDTFGNIGTLPSLVQFNGQSIYGGTSLSYQKYRLGWDCNNSLMASDNGDVTQFCLGWEDLVGATGSVEFVPPSYSSLGTVTSTPSGTVHGNAWSGNNVDIQISSDGSSDAFYSGNSSSCTNNGITVNTYPEFNGFVSDYFQCQSVILYGTVAVPITLSFVQPVLNSTVSPFYNWELNIQNATSSLLSPYGYSLNVSSYIPGYTSAKVDSLNNFFVSSSVSQNIFVNYNPTTYNLNIPVNATVTVIASAKLFDLQSFNGSVFQTVGNATTSFILKNTGQQLILYQDGSTSSQSDASGIFSPINAAPLACSNPSSSFFVDPGDNLAYAFCSAFGFLFVPSPGAIDYVGQVESSSLNVFPFSIFFGVLPTINNNIQNENVATSSVFDLVVDLPPGTRTTLFEFNSSTLVNALSSGATSTIPAQNSVNNLFLYIKILIWVTTGITAIIMITTV